MRRPLWSVISLITANVALAAAILLGIFVHWGFGVVAVGVLASLVFVPLLSRWRRL